MKPCFRDPKPSLFALLLSLLISGCTTVPVNQDYDSTADFSAIRSVEWLPASMQVIPKASEFERQQPLIAKRIQKAIQQSLSRKGIALLPEKADAYVTYHVVVKSSLRAEPVTTSFGIGTFGRHGGVLFHTVPEVYEYEERTLLIDILNRQGNVLWRGSSPTFLTQQSTPQKTTELVNAVVRKILAQYPPDVSR